MILTLKEIQQWAHTIAASKGFGQTVDDINLGEKIALMHSELSEALEALRRPKPQASEKIPEFLEIEEEMADTIIRICHLAEIMDWDLEGAINAKLEYNRHRSLMHGGKKF